MGNETGSGSGSGSGSGWRAGRTWVLLIHWPIRDRRGKTVATAVTNLDVHDIARACRTYGVAGYVIVTPVAAQREHVESILAHWRDSPDLADHRRREALEIVRVAPDLGAAARLIRDACGSEPFMVATSAAERPGALERHELARRAGERPVGLCFGTGWGLADEVFESMDATMKPIDQGTGFNHLSVRAAVAIMLDRLFGSTAR